MGYYVLGDSAYPLQSWLLKPFPDNGQLTAEQHTYNEMQGTGCSRKRFWETERKVALPYEKE